jgi:hypothetical protein
LKKEKRKNNYLKKQIYRSKKLVFLLKSFFFLFDFHRFCQSGFYIDFFVKKIGEVFVRNIFIYGAQFFSEKFIIEQLTKKVFESTI